MKKSYNNIMLNDRNNLICRNNMAMKTACIYSEHFQYERH